MEIVSAILWVERVEQAASVPLSWQEHSQTNLRHDALFYNRSYISIVYRILDRILNIVDRIFVVGKKIYSVPILDFTKILWILK